MGAERIKSELLIPQDIYLKEQAGWQEILGIKIEINKPLPKAITPFVKNRLDHWGFEIVYMPNINLYPDKLQELDIPDYLNFLNRHYPNWKSYESLNSIEQKDYKTPRNLEQWFWEKLKEGKIGDSQTIRKEQWIAVETIEKPNATYIPDRTDMYPQPDIIVDNLGLNSRFGKSWYDISTLITKNRNKILKQIGLGSAEFYMQLPEALTLNLLANRFGLGQTRSSEYTSTFYLDNDRLPHPLSIGNCMDGGAANVNLNDYNKADKITGFRVMITF